MTKKKTQHSLLPSPSPQLIALFLPPYFLLLSFLFSLCSPVPLSAVFAIALFLKPYVFQAYRKDTNLLLLILFLRVSPWWELFGRLWVADIGSGMNGFQHSRETPKPLLCSATAVCHPSWAGCPLPQQQRALIPTCPLFSISHFTPGRNNSNGVGFNSSTLNFMEHKKTITN